MTKLMIHDTHAGEKVSFQPIDPAHVRIYVCGPTVYDRAHLGNARPVVVFDTFVRLLRHLYPKVTYVRNITDVDDKINTRSQESGRSIADITAETTQMFHDDMAALNAMAPDVEPRATAHIPHMIDMIAALIAKGHAYAAEGHVLFDVKSYAAYGALSKRSLDDMIAGARVEVAPYKRNPADFVLWKPSDAQTPGWESPWGYGRPGWHIECSAMSREYLGETFDIHGGGRDLIFPHHENEIAQSCCASGATRYAKYWMHNGYLMVNGDKMSKSLGNFFTVYDLLQNHAGEAMRLYMLSSQYRSPVDWREDGLKAAKVRLDRYYRALQDADADCTADADVAPALVAALCDDLNTPKGLSVLDDLAGQVLAATGAEKARLQACLRRSGQMMGLLYQDAGQWFQATDADGLTAAAIEQCIEDRKNARQARDFAKADQIRDDLLAQGIILEDGASGTTWRKE
jgi:cysteinyl-tRNA synthetase